MKKRRLFYYHIITSYFLLILSGCVTDYDINKNFDKAFRRKVVVNSFICPESAITLKLFWSRKYNDKNEFSTVDNASVDLYEDDEIIKSGEVLSGFFDSGIYPKTDKTYSVRITVPDYGIVTAATKIPKSATADITYIHKAISEQYHHFEFDRIEPAEKLRAVWLEAYAVYEKSGRYKYNSDFYTDNPFLDQINSAMDDTDVAKRGSNISFEYFIRIPSPNFRYIDPLRFSVYAQPQQWIFPGSPEWNESTENGKEELSEVVVKLLSPSDEYDKYCRSLYKQDLYNYDPETPFLDEKVPVFSNIENGLGIFAGYSQVLLKHKFGAQ